ncbi:MAG: S8 family peptidase [Bdellovibrionales bacterium]
MKQALLAALFFCAVAATANERGDYLVQMAPSTQSEIKLMALAPAGSKIESLGVNNWYRVRLPADQASAFRAQGLMQNKAVNAVQSNFVIRPFESSSLNEARAQFKALGLDKNSVGIQAASPDNPSIPSNGSGGNGADPLFNNQWGMRQANVKNAWEKGTGSPEMIVAVIDTGVDYTHEDLVDNMWRNTNEIPGNNVDDDKNGYVDDIVGWDFADNDNKPYDKYGGFTDILNGKNPGHGTHCAGNVAARGSNGKGISGVAPNVRIMGLRFITYEGSGTTADAIKAIKYAVDNGAKVLSNSWGSEGEDPNDPDSGALKDAIRYAEGKGALFVAAAGNGHQGRGYNNDTDSRPAYPASYDMESIISVAAINSSGSFGSFSNWGVRSVDIGAPGVKVFSTVPAARYQDSIGNFLGQELNWDGTSMAAPHVAGAVALYWSAHPEKTWQQVKSALLASVKKTSQMSGKVSSGGQLDVQALMNQ